MFPRKMQILLRVHDVAEIRARRRDGRVYVRGRAVGFDLYASHGSVVRSMIYMMLESGEVEKIVEKNAFPRWDAVRWRESIN